MEQQINRIASINKEIEDMTGLIGAARYKYKNGKCTHIEMMYMVTDLNCQITELYMKRMELMLAIFFD